MIRSHTLASILHWRRMVIYTEWASWLHELYFMAVIHRQKVHPRPNCHVVGAFPVTQSHTSCQFSSGWFQVVFFQPSRSQNLPHLHRHLFSRESWDFASLPSRISSDEAGPPLLLDRKQLMLTRLGKFASSCFEWCWLGISYSWKQLGRIWNETDVLWQ